MRLIQSAFAEFFGHEPFIRLLAGDALPDTKNVTFTNFVDIAFRRYDISLGAGLGELAGKVFRIGHLGDMNALTLAGALAGVEMALADAGVSLTLGSGVGAALSHWRVPA